MQPHRSFARRFVRMAVSRRPPAFYHDGRWAYASMIAGLYVPTLLVDIFSFFFFGVFKLTTW